MKCANDKCRWRGVDGECRLFAGVAAAECKYREAAGKAAGTRTATRKGQPK